MEELLAVLVILVIAAAIIGGMGSGVWKAFTKAGKPGWAGIVPFYNNIVMAEIAGKPVWWGCLCWIPYLGIIPYIVLCSAISKKFGKGIEMTICLSFGFGWIILGWGRARYSDDLEVAKNLEKQGITTCVWCLEEVKLGARVCKHCGKNPLEEVEVSLRREAEEKAKKAAADKMEGELIRKREEEIRSKRIAEKAAREERERHEEKPQRSCSKCGKAMFKTPHGNWVCENC